MASKENVLINEAIFSHLDFLLQPHSLDGDFLTQSKYDKTRDTLKTIFRVLVLKVWYPRPFQGDQEVTIIFVMILRHYLPFFMHILSEVGSFRGLIMLGTSID